MFGSFKRVSESEQQMIDRLAIDVLELIEQLPEEFLLAMPEKQRRAIEKYEAACNDVLKYGRLLPDGSFDNMQRMLWNMAFKQLSAASKILEETHRVIEQHETK